MGIKDRLPEIEEWYREGALDIDVCKRLGINSRTLYRWKNRYPEFVKTVTAGKSPANIEVINAVYRNCVGYEYVELKKEQVIGLDGKLIGHKETQTKKFFPGTPGDRKMWVINRCGWSYKAEISIEENPLDDVENWSPERKQKFIDSGGQKS